MVVISAAVEGLVDEAVAKRLITEVGAIPGTIYGKNGKAALRSRIVGYNKAAAYAPWFILVDLDHEDCAPNLRRNWLPTLSPHLCFRIAIREIEAWLFADRERLAKFLSLPLDHIAANPEVIANPKEEMVRLAAASRSKKICQDMAPRPESGRSVGPAYTSRLIEFVTTAQAESCWRPDIAQTHSDSLRRAIACLRRLVESAA
ncbi:MAG: hypothetical protein AAB359_07830 [Elusimicrobiota bacterium]